MPGNVLTSNFDTSSGFANFHAKKKICIMEDAEVLATFYSV
jgi:hypothetical protein